MKKISILLLSAVMLSILTGCAPSDPAPRQEGFTFTYNGIQITPDADAAPVIEALGEPKSYTEEPSCAFDGMDKTYYYGSFYLSTYPLDGTDHIYSIWFADDSVATDEGIRIGSTQAQVEDIYGANCFQGSNACTQTQGDSKLTILLTDGLVSSIQYALVLE